MANTLKLPVGIDDFRKLRESHFYYVDKTRLIEQLLLNWSEVTLFTRPRRFGKTLYLMAYIFQVIKSCVMSTWESIRLFFFRLRVWRD